MDSAQWQCCCNERQSEDVRGVAWRGSLQSVGLGDVLQLQGVGVGDVLQLETPADGGSAIVPRRSTNGASRNSGCSATSPVERFGVHLVRGSLERDGAHRVPLTTKCADADGQGLLQEEPSYAEASLSRRCEEGAPLQVLGKALEMEFAQDTDAEVRREEAPCLSCGGLGCGMCRAELLQKQRLSQQQPSTAEEAACLACGGLGCGMCRAELLQKQRSAAEEAACLACGGLGCSMCRAGLSQHQFSAAKPPDLPHKTSPPEAAAAAMTGATRPEEIALLDADPVQQSTQQEALPPPRSQPPSKGSAGGCCAIL